MFYAYKPG